MEYSSRYHLFFSQPHNKPYNQCDVQQWYKASTFLHASGKKNWIFQGNRSICISNLFLRSHAQINRMFSVQIYSTENELERMIWKGIEKKYHVRTVGGEYLCGWTHVHLHSIPSGMEISIALFGPQMSRTGKICEIGLFCAENRFMQLRQ